MGGWRACFDILVRADSWLLSTSLMFVEIVVIWNRESHICHFELFNLDAVIKRSILELNRALTTYPTV
jgi:hypothetical protein